METVTINIALNEDGSFKYGGRYAGWSVGALRDGSVQWVCEHPFAILFGEDSPFQEASFSGIGSTDPLRVRPNATSGSYEYAVVVFPEPDQPPKAETREVCIDG